MFGQGGLEGQGPREVQPSSAKVHHLAPSTVAMISALARPPKNEHFDQTQCPEFINAVCNTFDLLPVLNAREIRRAEVLYARKLPLGGNIQ